MSLVRVPDREPKKKNAGVRGERTQLARYLVGLPIAAESDRISTDPCQKVLVITKMALHKRKGEQILQTLGKDK